MGPILPPGEQTAPEGRRVFISYKRNVEPDASVAAFFRDALGREGHAVFIDVDMVPGTDWPELISAQIREAEFFVVLLSKASVAKGSYVTAETLAAHVQLEQTGLPRVVPVRLKYTEDLPLQLAGKIGNIHDIRWRSAADNDAVLTKLLETIGPASTRPSVLERGDHFIVTPALWLADAARESVEGTTIVPVTAGGDAQLAVSRASRPGLFSARVGADGGLEVAIWKGSAYRLVESRPGSFIKMLEDDSHAWCFERYAPDACVLLARGGGRRHPIVITFDREHVQSAWRITHQRGTQQESFLIVSRHRSTG
jgi:hypothetical protein